MRQLKERITHAFGLAPLPPKDIKEYIDFRLRAAGYHGPDLFGPDALRIIAEASEGLTRRINIYADKTLLAAFAAGTHTVSADHARAAVSDTQIVVATKPASRPLALAGIAGLAVGIAIGFGGAKFLDSWPSVTAVVASSAPPARPAPAPASAAVATGTIVSAAPEVAPTTEAAAPPVAPPSASDSQKEPPGAPPSPPVEVAREARIPASAPPENPASISSRLSAGLALLGGDSDGRFVVQLMMTDAAESGYLASYLAQASRALSGEEIFLYPSGSTESPKIGVVYGTFQTRRAANEAMNALPENLRRFRPYIRALEAVRADVRRGALS